MNSNEIEPHEILHRGITTNPDMWKTSTGRPSSAAFKQSASLSVVRYGGREFEDIKKSLISNVKKPLKAVAFFSVQKCFDKEMQVRPDPNPDGQNPYHALIDDSKEIIGIGKVKAKYLASICDFKLVQ